jgi:hypothetical protein
MLGRLFLHKKLNANKEPTPPNPKFFFGVMFVILLATGIMQLMAWQTTEERSLITQAPGLVIFETVDEVRKTVPLPTETFDANVFTSGLYTQSTNTFPKGTIAIVYTKQLAFRRNRLSSRNTRGRICTYTRISKRRRNKPYS